MLLLIDHSNIRTIIVLRAEIDWFFDVFHFPVFSGNGLESGFENALSSAPNSTGSSFLAQNARPHTSTMVSRRVCGVRSKSVSFSTRICCHTSAVKYRTRRSEPTAWRWTCWTRKGSPCRTAYCSKPGPRSRTTRARGTIRNSPTRYWKWCTRRTAGKELAVVGGFVSSRC